MTARPVHLSLWVSILVLGASPGAAQTTASTGRFHVGVGAGWMTGASVGEQSANLRSSGNSPLRLFQSQTDITDSGLVEARIGFTLTPRFDVEGRAALSRPQTRTLVSGDVESAASATLVESIDQFVFDGGVRIKMYEWQAIDLHPFVSVGAGYIRQLHEGQTLVEEAQIYYVGGGVTRALVSRSRGLVRRVSVRGDARLNVLTGGLDEDSRRHASFSGDLILTF